MKISGAGAFGVRRLAAALSLRELAPAAQRQQAAAMPRAVASHRPPRKSKGRWQATALPKRDVLYYLNRSGIVSTRLSPSALVTRTFSSPVVPRRELLGYIWMVPMLSVTTALDVDDTTEYVSAPESVSATTRKKLGKMPITVSIGASSTPSSFASATSTVPFSSMSTPMKRSPVSARMRTPGTNDG